MEREEEAMARASRPAAAFILGGEGMELWRDKEEE
jgi:hypothetical protein